MDGSLRATILKSAARVSIGTTHFVNAVVERASDKLAPIAAIRLCGPASRSLPPFADFPSNLKQLFVWTCVHGGWRTGVQWEGDSTTEPRGAEEHRQ